MKMKRMASRAAAAMLFLALLCGGGGADEHHLRRRDAAARMESFRASRSLATSPSSSPAPAARRGRVYHVTDYGADPTGNADSTAAIAKAIADAFSSPASNRTLIAGVADLGGAEVDLDGGDYLISSPLSFPAGGAGNFRLHGGSLRSSPDFPTGRYLIELWDGRSSSPASSSYSYEYITLRDLYLDCGYRGGGIAVVDALRTGIDSCYITHFATDGVWVLGGHETLIRSSFIGQHITAGADAGERSFSGTGINLAGPDNTVTDTVIFSAATGILITAPANTITGVHCYNKAAAFGGVGVAVGKAAAHTRIVSSYLDYTGVVAEDPEQLLVTGCFFLGDAAVVLKAGAAAAAKGVMVVNNVFSGGGTGVDIVQLDESGEARFAAVEQVVVERNVVSGMKVKATAAKGSVSANASRWILDFSPVLLFPGRIRYVQYTLVPDAGDGGFPAYALRNTSENRVVVAASAAVAATVHVMVDQNGS